MQKNSRNTTGKESSLHRLWSQRKGDLIILVSSLAAVGLIGWIVSDNPIGVEDEWTWPAQIKPGGRYIPVVIAVALLIAAAGWLTRPKRWEKTSRRWRAVWLVVLVLIAWLLASSLLFLFPSPVSFTAGIIVSKQATSYFTVAVDIENLPDALQHYPELMAKLPQHARTHPPGPILFFWAINQIVQNCPGLAHALEATAFRLDKDGTRHLTEVLNNLFGLHLTQQEALAAVLSAFVLAAAGSLTLIPLYLLGVALYKPTTALYSVLLFITVPSFLLFAPSIDQLVLLFTVLILWGFILLRRKGNPIIGLFFALGVLISLGILAIGLFIALWWLADWIIKRKTTSPYPQDATMDSQLRKIIIGVIAAILIFIATFILLRIALGLDIIATVKTGLAMHKHVTLAEEDRTYSRWVVYNLVEFACFLGLPVAIWAIVGLRKGFGIAWLATLLILNFSGWVLAETGRIWLFLMPPAALLATARIEQLGKRFDLGFFSALVLQLGIAVTMKAAIDLFILL